MTAIVHQLRPEQELTTRFRDWWAKQDKHTKQAIREIVADDRKPATKSEALEVLDFLNLKAGRRYKPLDVTLNMIRARIAESSVEECKAVIVVKVREWKDDEHMNKYLRPATLFSRVKFAQYSGEIGE